jgi:hypothetical protein
MQLAGNIVSFPDSPVLNPYLPIGDMGEVRQRQRQRDRRANILAVARRHLGASIYRVDLAI